MTSSNHRALIVEDEVMIRNLTIRALSREGFECDSAADGDEAILLAGVTNYEVVVTDLKMPNMNGHELSVALLDNTIHRPLIVVLTGVAEPRLAKDLLARGVNEIIYKPVDYSVLAKKIRELAERGLNHPPTQPADGDATLGHENVGVAMKGGPQSRIEVALPTIGVVKSQAEPQRLDARLPMSEELLKVYRKSNSDDFDMADLSREISKNEFLANEIIMLANRPFYNPKGAEIGGLARAVIQIGQKRVWQVAMTATLHAALRSGGSSPENLSLSWRSGIAAGLAVEIMIDQGKHKSIGDRLLLCATMLELGRVAMAKLYPFQYQQMIIACETAGRSVHELEHSFFPVTLEKILSDFLHTWGLDESTFQPVRHSQDSHDLIAQLPEPLKTQVRLVKLAGLVARLAIGSGNRWDEVTVLPRDIAKELRLESIESVIHDTRRNIEGMVKNGECGSSIELAESSRPSPRKL